MILSLFVGLSYFQTNHSLDYSDQMQSEVAVFSDADIGISFAYEAGWGKLLVQNSVQNCIEEEAILEAEGQDNYEQYADIVDSLSGRECIKY